MTEPKKNDPFQFYARFSLAIAAGRRAATLKELRDGVAELPETVIYRHTHRFMADHQALVPEPSNDFALWAAEALQDEPLGERLAAVDVLRYSTLADLRAALLGVLDKAPDHGRRAPPGREFHFVGAKRFSVPTDLFAADIPSFIEALAKAPPSSLFLHLYESRLRPPLGVNDFSVWLSKSQGEVSLAQAVDGLDLVRHTLEEVRAGLLDILRNHLKGVSHVAS